MTQEINIYFVKKEDLKEFYKIYQKWGMQKHLPIHNIIKHNKDYLILFSGNYPFLQEKISHLTEDLK